ncbi:MAG: hypothetical protein GY951_18515 [Psychromonas sp.]|nr:hypothetical protein [Alteromonadales bacterium]MCP5080025.1 hypothetical protein [Psychromonas sp.]
MIFHSVMKRINLTKPLFHIILFALFLLPPPTFAEVIFKEVQLVEDDLLLLDVKLNNNYVANSIDAFPHGERTLIAIEPLFEALNVKYQLHTDQLIIWKEDNKYTLALGKRGYSNFFSQIDPTITNTFWANDGFYLFIDKQTVASFFDVKIDINTFQLRMKITTDKFLFPLQQLETLRQQRILAAVASSKRETQEKVAPEITIADQYRLFTVPHGRVSTLFDIKKHDRNNQVSVQLTSDLLYHSANLTLGKVNSDELSTNLKFSRYKTKPDNYILGAFDKYSFGDVTGYSNNLTTKTNSGLGVQFNRTPKNFRRRNLAITIEETAPPGWEAELFHNNRFIAVTIVPDNGTIIFEDVLTEYGNNYYQIKLYGPYGEVEVIEKYLNLTKNALSKKAIAYNLYGLDRNHRLINDQSNTEREFTDFGGTLDYGISDRWQVGLGFANTTDASDGVRQLYSMKNAFSFPGFLIENDFSFNKEFGYAQLTSATGNIFNKERFTLGYESADDYNSARINAKDSHVDIFHMGISGSISRWGYGLSGAYRSQEKNKNWSIRNNFSRSFGQIYFTHNLSYSNYETEIVNSADPNDPNGTTENIILTDNYLQGAVNLSGTIVDRVRLSANIGYDPTISSPIPDNSTMTLQWSPTFYGVKNYFTARYLPLTNSDNDWQLSYRTALNMDEYELNLGTYYNADETWNVNLGIRFFIGYDYHNNNLLFRNKTSNQSATLNAHAYLDRQANGIPDPLDYNLSGVEFIGVPDWVDIKSGESGRVILPGVTTGGEFRFDAKWQDGSKTVNNNYVIYTHPGAYVDVNMPFNLTTEISGFVQRVGNDAPLRNVAIKLNSKHNPTLMAKTDSDGYFEFLDLPPGDYELQVTTGYLREKGLTADIIGYHFASPKSGGFIELATLTLRRSNDDTDIAPETIVEFELTENNSEAIIWDDNKNKLREYFTLPPKGKVAVKHSLSEADVALMTGANKALKKTKTAPLIDISTEPTIATAINNKQGLLPSVTLPDEPLPKAPPLPHKEIETTTEQQTPVNKSIIAKDSKITEIQSYTIQLGVFSSKALANALVLKLTNLPKIPYVTQNRVNGAQLYSVLLGDFNNKTEANNFAKNNLEIEQDYYIKKIANKTIKKGWVIQYYAGASSNSQEKTAQNFTIKVLFTATKKSTKKSTLYCLISEVFDSKEAATLAKKQNNIDGWITSSAPYRNITRIK